MSNSNTNTNSNKGNNTVADINNTKTNSSNAKGGNVSNFTELGQYFSFLLSLGEKNLPQGLATILFNGNVFKKKTAFRGTGFEDQGFKLIAHQGVDRTIGVKGVAFFNSLARIKRQDETTYAWDTVYPSYFGAKTGAKIKLSPSFGNGFSASLKNDGYMIAMCDEDGLQPMFFEDSFRGFKKPRTPLSTILQSSVANLDPQGDQIRAAILKNIQDRFPALLATNHGLELRVMLVFEHIFARKNRYEDSDCPFFVTIKGDCWGVWARPFNPDAFRTTEINSLAERMDEFKNRSGIGRMVGNMTEEEYAECSKFFKIKDGPQATTEPALPLESPGIQQFSSALAKKPKAPIAVEDVFEDPFDMDLDEKELPAGFTLPKTEEAPQAKFSIEELLEKIEKAKDKLSPRQKRTLSRLKGLAGPLSSSDEKAAADLGATIGARLDLASASGIPDPDFNDFGENIPPDFGDEEVLPPRFIK